MEKYYIVYNPLTLDLMHLLDICGDVTEVISDLTGLDYSQINNQNYTNYLKLNLNRQKRGMVDTLALESKAADYVANQISKIDPVSRIILADSSRRSIEEIINERGKPAAVFITSMSANFPTAALTSIVLNHAKIPVIIGGVHVSSSKDDLDVFIKKVVPFPELVTQVTGPGDSKVFIQILKGLRESKLEDEYVGTEMIEDGIWGAENIETMEPMDLVFLEKLPVIGRFIKKLIRINPIAPYLGCPFSCNFCSISTIPVKQRRLVARSAEDFVAEIKYIQRGGVGLDNRIFFFLPDNLLLGGDRLEEMLDLIIESDLVINYAAQISIEVAHKPHLLEKLRKSGATHFFIGFESLNIDNLKFIGKNIVSDIEKSGKTVRQYYSEMIKIIQSYGISIHGAFIFGMPFDNFDSVKNHTGKEIADFCKEHHIGVQGCPLTDLPGSKNFQLAQKNNTYVYGKQGTMGYFLSLCVSDLSECNRKPPESLFESMLVVLHMTYEAVKQVGSHYNVMKNAFFVFKKAFKYPTKSGKMSFRERVIDAFIAASAQMIVNNLYHADETVYSKPEVKGSYERYFAREEHAEIKTAFKKHVRQFALKRNGL
ncbi:radical SAM protein [bacterium]|nr:radical SAM protein [bacterium]